VDLRREVVKDSNAFPAGEKRIGQMRTDEPRALDDFIQRATQGHPHELALRPPHRRHEDGRISGTTLGELGANPATRNSLHGA
jgi:hypothetical protein